MVVLHRQLVDPEVELLGDRQKAFRHGRPHVGIAEHAAPLRAPDPMVLAVVLRMTTRAPGHPDILA